MVPSLCTVIWNRRILQTEISLFSGPWNHGQWGGINAESLGRISFGSNTAEWFHDLQKRWFDFWLKGEGDGNFAEAFCFQTGTNVWKTYDTWPPKNAEIKKLYARMLTIPQALQSRSAATDL